MSYIVADLHCDLLSYLENSGRTPYDAAARCSIPQLRSGRVKFQTLAVFAETGPLSVKHGLAQLAIYQNLPILYPKDFIHFHEFPSPSFNEISIALACEGASVFCAEEEPLELGFKRLKEIIQHIAKPIYISLTWGQENRFGGGNLTSTGLKPDGERLLDELHQQEIAIDFSHTSDALAYDLLNYIDKYQLDIPLLASHSNSRAIYPVPRNLPDEIAKEILLRKGVIGFNLYHPFVGPSKDYLIKHLQHWIELGGQEQVCLGADFFYENDFTLNHYEGIKDRFFSDFSNASCYPKLLNLFYKELNLTPEIVEGIAHQNLSKFLLRKSANESK